MAMAFASRVRALDSFRWAGGAVSLYGALGLHGTGHHSSMGLVAGLTPPETFSIRFPHWPTRCTPSRNQDTTALLVS